MPRISDAQANPTNFAGGRAVEPAVIVISFSLIFISSSETGHERLPGRPRSAQKQISEVMAQRVAQATGTPRRDAGAQQFVAAAGADSTMSAPSQDGALIHKPTMRLNRMTSLEDCAHGAVGGVDL